MEITLALATFPDLGITLGTAGRGSALARLRGAGTHCTLCDVPPAGALGKLHAALTAEVGREVLALDLAPSELEGLTNAAATCLLLIDGSERRAPEVVFAGAHLPSHGDLGSVQLDDLLATLGALTGRGPGRGRNLLEVEGEAWDGELDRQLTERLRQLYGE